MALRPLMQKSSTDTEKKTMSSLDSTPKLDCQSCGACCAYSCCWPEFVEEEDGDGIPEEMCDCDSGRMKCNGDRCVALIGDIGVKVSCVVYQNRPSVCQEFPHGDVNNCNTVRRRFKLPPIQ